MTERERWWATATVWMEARGEPEAGQIAVAHVILNRLQSRRWGETVGEVCLAAKQFSCWDSMSPTRKPLARVDENSGSWLAAKGAVMAADLGVRPDVTEGALHYYATSLLRPPFWDKAKTLPRVTIGRHVFVRGVA